MRLLGAPSPLAFVIAYSHFRALTRNRRFGSIDAFSRFQVGMFWVWLSSFPFYCALFSAMAWFGNRIGKLEALALFFPVGWIVWGFVERVTARDSESVARAWEGLSSRQRATARIAIHLALFTYLGAMIGLAILTKRIYFGTS